ncbi:MAG: dihydroorotase [Candidatus Marinimicrobia bacterium]|nr:dihydroorotase [Candidatus Neomarinimicrobiota bacterium]
MNVNRLNKDLYLKNGIIYDPYNQKSFEGSIWVRDGRIAGVGDFETPNLEDMKIIDCSNKIITHGFCDLHAHFRSFGEDDKEDFESGARSALSGGFTRVCVMPNTLPPIDSPEYISFVKQTGDKTPVHVHPIGAVTKNQDGKQITEMSLMYNEGAVAFSDDGLPIQNGAIMRTALEYSKFLNVPVINHAEDECLRGDGLMNEGLVSTHLGLKGNPDIAESVMVLRDLELAHYTGAILHVPHVTTKKAVEHIKRMRVHCKNITAEVTPHHLYFNDTELMNYDTNLKVAPPIRSEEDRQALIQGLKDGSIDCIATDHAPHRLEEKETTFDIASCGMIGLESCFGAVNKVLCKDNGLKVEKVIEMITVIPRKIMNFKVDLFALNTPAELTVLDTKKYWKFSREDIKSKSLNSPFIGKSLKGKILHTISKNFLASN